MKKTLVIPALLTLVCAITHLYADNLIYVNATSAPIHIIGEFYRDPDADGACRAWLDEQIEPGGVFSHNISNCYLKTLLVTNSEGIRLQRDFRMTEYVDAGMFTIRFWSYGYEIAGPYRQRDVRGTLFLVNATGFYLDYLVDYHSIFCRRDTGGLADSQIEEFRIGACLTELVYGTFTWFINGRVAVKQQTNHYTGSTGNGTFVFRKKAGAPGQFEVVGPFKE